MQRLALNNMVNNGKLNSGEGNPIEIVILHLKATSYL